MRGRLDVAGRVDRQRLDRRRLSDRERAHVGAAVGRRGGRAVERVDDPGETGAAGVVARRQVDLDRAVEPAVRRRAAVAVAAAAVTVEFEVGAVTSGAGALSDIAKSSIVTAPAPPEMPIPTERLVTPAGIAGVDQLACVQPDWLASTDDWAK